nr:response regulator transcription factor [Lysobacter sp. BMK333-48F3]
MRRGERIVIAERLPVMQRFLHDLVEKEFGPKIDSLRIVSSSEGLLDVLTRDSPDLVIVDPCMPAGTTGIALLREAVLRCRDAKIVVHTANEHGLFALAALELGIKAYVLKISSPDLLLSAIRQISAGSALIDPSVDLDSATRHAWSTLTPAERDVMLRLAKGMVVNRIAIDIGRSYKTVATHKYNAKRKLGLRSKEEIIPFFVANGLDYLLDEH